MLFVIVIIFKEIIWLDEKSANFKAAEEILRTPFSLLIQNKKIV